MRITTAFRTTLATSLLGQINAGIARAYNGTRPTNPDTALSGNTLLAEMTLNDPAGTVSNGVLTINVTSVTDASANASGTPTFVRLFAANGTTALVDFSAAVGSGEWNFSAAIVAAAPVPLSSASITVPVGT